MLIKITVAVMLEHGQLFVGCFVEPTTITRTRTNSPHFRSTHGTFGRNIGVSGAVLITERRMESLPV